MNVTHLKDMSASNFFRNNEIPRQLRDELTFVAVAPPKVQSIADVHFLILEDIPSEPAMACIHQEMALKLRKIRPKLTYVLNKPDDRCQTRMLGSTSTPCMGWDKFTPTLLRDYHRTGKRQKGALAKVKEDIRFCAKYISSDRTKSDFDETTLAAYSYNKREQGLREFIESRRGKISKDELFVIVSDIFINQSDFLASLKVPLALCAFKKVTIERDSNPMYIRLGQKVKQLSILKSLQQQGHPISLLNPRTFLPNQLYKLSTCSAEKMFGIQQTDVIKGDVRTLSEAHFRFISIPDIYDPTMIHWSKQLLSLTSQGLKNLHIVYPIELTDPHLKNYARGVLKLLSGCKITCGSYRAPEISEAERQFFNNGETTKDQQYYIDYMKYLRTRIWNATLQFKEYPLLQENREKIRTSPEVVSILFNVNNLFGLTEYIDKLGDNLFVIIPTQYVVEEFVRLLPRNHMIMSPRNFTNTDFEFESQLISCAFKILKEIRASQVKTNANTDDPEMKKRVIRKFRVKQSDRPVLGESSIGNVQNLSSRPFSKADEKENKS